MSAFGEAEASLRRKQYRKAWLAMDGLPKDDRDSFTALSVKMRAAAGMGEIETVLTLAAFLLERDEATQRYVWETFDAILAGLDEEGRISEAEELRRSISKLDE